MLAGKQHPDRPIGKVGIGGPVLMQGAVKLRIRPQRISAGGRQWDSVAVPRLRDIDSRPVVYLVESKVLARESRRLVGMGTGIDCSDVRRILDRIEFKSDFAE